MKTIKPVRTPVYLKTKTISDGKSYDGTIGNLSERGAYVEIDPTRTAIPFLPRKKLELKFQVSPKKILKLNCEVIWLYTKRKPPHSLVNSVGMEIINPSLGYKKFFETL